MKQIYCFIDLLLYIDTTCRLYGEAIIHDHNKE
jgi:hypothetical protein